MKSPSHQLSALNGEEAIKLLHTLASSDIDYPHYAQEMTALSNLPLGPEQQADIARDTLMVMAEQNPQQAEAITVLLNNPAPNRFDAGTTIATFVGVAVLLRIHVKIERDPQGKWSLLIEHKPTDSALLNKLLKKIETLIKHGEET